MNDLPCEIVKDLLPSYVDGLTSESTNTAIKQHLAGCQECRALYENMKAEEKHQFKHFQKEINYMKKFKKHYKRIILLTIVTAVAAVIIAFVKPYLISDSDPIYTDFTVTVNGSCMTAAGTTWPGRSFTKQYALEKDGIVTIYARTVVSSTIHPQNTVNLEFNSAEIIQKVIAADGRILWENGTAISQKAMELWNSLKMFLKMDDSEAMIHEIHNIRTGYGTNPLFRATNGETDSYEDGAKKCVYDTLYNLDRLGHSKDEFEFIMRKNAYVFFALCPAYDIVKYSFCYTDTEQSDMTVTSEEASEAIGSDIKKSVNDIVSLQKLLNLLELND